MNVVRSLLIPTALSLVAHAVLLGLTALVWTQFFLSHELVAREFQTQGARLVQNYQATIEGAAMTIVLQSALLSLAATVIWFLRCLIAPREAGRMARNMPYWLVLMIVALIAANIMGYFTLTAQNVPQLMDRSALVWHIVAFEIIFMLVYWIASAVSTEKALRVAVPLASVLP